MKKVIFIAFTLISYFGNAQSLYIDMDSSLSGRITIDSARSWFVVCCHGKDCLRMNLKDSSLEVLDTIGAIKTLIKTMNNLLDQQREQNERFWAAQNVLSYINTQGYVLNKDRVKFNKAVVAYSKTTKQKGKVEPMQKLDILIRDLTGKAIGWVQQ